MTGPIATVIVGVLAAIVALYASYAQRRQMRQIELYKLDPSHPLKPPPNTIVAWIWKFLKMNFALLMMFFPIWGLVIDMKRTDALTALRVMDVAGHVTMIGVCFLVWVLLPLIMGLSQIAALMAKAISVLMQNAAKP